MTWVMVAPAIDPTITARWIDGLKLPHERVLIVDNAKPRRRAAPGWNGPVYRAARNLGVPASWNLGVDLMRNRGADWLVLCSTAVKWGDLGGIDFVTRVDDVDPAVFPAVSSGEGWHLCAIHTTVFDQVGLFDENFYPGYWEDTDYLYRMGLAGLPSPRENGRDWAYVGPVDCEYGEQAHSLKWCRPVFGELGAYYAAKWGGPQGEETFTTPFGEDHPIDWWRGVRNRREFTL